MSFKLYHCALVVGLALGGAAVADPGQAGGLVVQNQPALAGEIVTLPKGSVPGKAIYRYATRQMEIVSMPVVGQGDSVSLRGPVPHELIWDATAGYAHWQVLNTVYATAEVQDGGILCGDPGTTIHTVNQFQFGYVTNTIDPTGTALGLSIALYWNYDPTCTPGPNGSLADWGPACIAANTADFEIIELPGSTDGALVGWDVTIDLAGGFEVTIPAGSFGYSYHDWTGPWSVNTGPILVGDNQITAPGANNNFHVWPGGYPQQGVAENLWFGAANWAQFQFQVYAEVGCAPTTSGACCVADTCSVAADQAACDGLGGTFTLGTPCSTFFCFPAPANDDCLNAQVISGFGQFAYDNRGATATDAAPSCGPLGEDVWFRWTSPCTGDVSVSTCLLNTTDDLFAVYQGSNCGDLTSQIACDDDGCGVVGGQSTASFSVSAGTTYLLRMGTWNGTDGGQNFFDLTNVSCTGGPAFCDADWCQDGAVGVPDIFCFLSAWFANDPVARNYGGTPGVPAIFAFLSIWFATGQGPCTP